MLKSKLMKSLVVAGLICATSVPVFAAEQPEAPQPTMRERVEQILHEDDNNVRRPIPRPARRGPQLTEEQRQAREAARMAWMEMTPQQKFEQRQQMREDFLAQLPAEKRAAIEQRAAEAKAKWDSMTEEQKQSVRKQIGLLTPLLIRWYPDGQLAAMGKPNRGAVDDYASRLYEATGARFYKFRSGRFKTYFVLGTNCVLLADRLIGASGSDIIHVSGIITPGTYYDYLNRQYLLQNSNVISRHAYTMGNQREQIAKVESREGVEAMPELLPASDMIVIARGDLGAAFGIYALPPLQKRLAAACRAAGAPFMVVTQLLYSMQQNPVPTRAEVSDIYNAVLDGAAALMLTNETAAGKYPAEAMRALVLAAGADS